MGLLQVPIYAEALAKASALQIGHLELCQAFAGERVGTLVHDVPGVTLHPAPIDGVMRGGRLEPLP